MYAVAPGYIGRVVIRPDGYGKALYLWHSNGTMSVYAHLQSFTPEVMSWAKNLQYKRQSFYLDAELDSSTFPVKQGEFIGYSGNSGRSFGPHLHFEIRDRSQQPFNMVQRGIYSIADNTPPTAGSLLVYRFDTVQGVPLSAIDKTLALKQQNRALRVAAGDTVSIGGPAYFALDMRDRMNGSSSTYGVSRCELHLNDALIFSYSMDIFSFDETRYANAMLDFSKKPSNFVRLYVAPGNKLSVYQKVKNCGVVSLKKNEVAKASITLTDDAGNKSVLAFWVKQAAAKRAKKAVSGQNILQWNKSNTYEANGFKLSIPVGVLYENSPLSVHISDAARGSSSVAYNVTQPLTPPHRAVTVSIRASVSEALRSKATIVCMDKNGGKEALGTDYQAPYFTASTRSWGSFFVEIDTVAPQITPVNFVPGSRLGANQIRITFKVKDNLSGLKTYAGYIDGSWALFEYDVKNDYMTYEVDPARVKTGAQHTLTFTATDGVGNKETFLCELYF